MMIRSFRGALAALFATLLGTGCVVLPTPVHVADAGAGTAVFEACSLTPALPAGVKLERPRLQAVVSIVPGRRSLVRVQLDIPEGTTVILRESTVRIDARDGTALRVGRIADINPAAPARSPETAAIRKLVVPVDTPMRGGRIALGKASSDRHYWIAAPFDDFPAGDVWITLPELSVDGVSTRFDEIHFVRRLAIGVGMFNC